MEHLLDVVGIVFLILEFWSSAFLPDLNLDGGRVIAFVQLTDAAGEGDHDKEKNEHEFGDVNQHLPQRDLQGTQIWADLKWSDIGGS